MKILKYFLLYLILQISTVKCRGQNCSSVRILYEDAEKISSFQREIDQIIYKNGIVSTITDDPTFISFGEYPVDPIFVDDMLHSQDLLNFLRLLQEEYPDSWQNRYSCLNDNDRCPRRPEFTCGRERSLDGTCNNEQHPTMGASFTPYLRKFNSHFADGIDTIRRSKFLNNELPSPRHISNEIYAEQERRAATQTCVDSQDNNICNGKPSYSKPIEFPWKNQPSEYTFSFLGYMFGQLVAVDTANRIITKGADRTAPGFQCCRNPVAGSMGMAREISNPACLPLVYPANDPFFSQYNVTCGNFVRGATLIPSDCSMKTAEYGNAPTAYTDLSGVYGVDQSTSDSLRERVGGRMITNQYNVLPEEPNCTIPACYRAEEHYSSKYGIRCDRTKSPDCDKYRSDIDAAIIIEFTQAAGRGLHACTPDFVYWRSKDQTIERKLAFSDTLGVTNVLDHRYNSVLRGAICLPIHCTNISYSNEVCRWFLCQRNDNLVTLHEIE